MKTRPVTIRGPVPALWLLGDARNDAVLESVLARLPRGSGFVFRHYHLPPEARRRRFAALARLCRARGHVVALAGDAALARRWRADALYGSPERMAGKRAGALLRIATVHSLRELGGAHRAGADLVMISPVFTTRSHPGAAVLGPVRARLLAARAGVPVVMLGGMDRDRARGMAAYGWAAIDGLSR